jgi:hypothetical protein
MRGNVNNNYLSTPVSYPKLTELSTILLNSLMSVNGCRIAAIRNKPMLFRAEKQPVRCRIRKGRLRQPLSCWTWGDETTKERKTLLSGRSPQCGSPAHAMAAAAVAAPSPRRQSLRRRGQRSLPLWKPMLPWARPQRWPRRPMPRLCGAWAIRSPSSAAFAP